MFDLATRRHRAAQTGETAPGIGDLGDIVAVPPVREARDRGSLKAEPMFARLTPTGIAWSDGTTLDADAIIWCTGFRPGLGHLAPLRLRGHDGLIATEGTRAVGEPRLHLLGYGDWTGPASATLIGASRTAREAIVTITEQLGRQLVGSRGAEIAKRIDVLATGIHHGITVREILDLDLSYTPPLGSPWDALQHAARHWLTVTD